MRSGKYFIAICLVLSSLAEADTTYTVDVAGDANSTLGGTSSGATSGDLRYVLNKINLDSQSTPIVGTTSIVFSLGASNTITLQALLPMMNLFTANTVVMDGTNDGMNEIIIDGASLRRGFFIRQGSLDLSNITIQNVLAKGGDAGSGGGGGMGAGGAIFNDNAVVTLSSLTVNNCAATGGNGGAVGDGRGGGGLGGSSTVSASFGGTAGGGYSGMPGVGSPGGGGGGGGQGGVSGANSTGANAGVGGAGGTGGGGGGGGGAITAVVAGNGGIGGDGCGGGGGGGSPGTIPSSDLVTTAGTGGMGGYGGGGGGGGHATRTITGIAGAGGMGGFGGGGGCGGAEPGGNGGGGGFGGGGGSGGNGAGIGRGGNGGAGGFGGGGGGGAHSSVSTLGTAGTGGAGAGYGGSPTTATSSGGGGGAGVGGAFFCNTGSITIGDNVTFMGTFTTTAGAAGGAGATAGFAGTTAGNAIFGVSTGSLVFGNASGTVTVGSSIGDDSPFSLPGVASQRGAGTGTGLHVVKSGAGTVSLFATNTFIGGIELQEGFVEADRDQSLGGTYNAGTAPNAIVSFTGSSTLNLQPAAPTSFTRPISISSGINATIDTTTQDSTWAQTIMGGNGNLIVDGTTGSLTLSVPNTYTGQTSVNGGTLDLTDVDAISSSSGITVDATLNIGVASAIVPNLSGSGTVDLANSAELQNSVNTVFSGVVQDGGGFTKTGSGTLQLSGINTFTGAVSITAGQLSLTNADAASSSASTSVTFPAELSIDAASVRVNHLSGSGSLFINGDVDLFNTSIDTVFSGPISGSSNLIKEGAQMLTLSGSNASFTGGVSVLQGTLALGSSNAIGNASQTSVAATLDVQTSGAIVPNVSGIGNISLTQNGVFQNSTDTTFSGDITGAGTLTKTGASMLSLTGNNSYGGITTISAGTLSVTTSALPGNCFIGNGTTLIADQSTAGNLTGTLSDQGNFVKEGTGNVTLTASNTFTGSTTINDGILTLGNVNAVSTSSNVVADGALAIGISNALVPNLSGSGTLTLTNDAILQYFTDLTFSGVVEGAGGFTKTGNNQLSLTGASANTFTGDVSITTGRLSLGKTSAISTAANTSVTGTASLSIDIANAQVNQLSGDGSLLVNNAVILFNTTSSTVFSGPLSGNGSLEKEGADTLTLSGFNTGYLGAVTVTDGTLALGSVNAIVAASSTTVNNILDIQIDDAVVPNLQGSGSVLLTQNGIFQNANFTTFFGAISGSGTLTKTGSSTLRLTGTNTYGGLTTVSNGELSVTTSALPGDCTMQSGTMLTADQDVDGNLVGVLSGGGNLSKEGTGNVTLTAANIFTGSTTINTGTLTLGNVDAVSSSSDVTVNASLDVGASGAIIPNIMGSGTVTLTNSAVFENTFGTTFSGNIQGAGNFTKTGADQLALSTTNAFTGDTNVTDGLLRLLNANAIASSAQTVITNPGVVSTEAVNTLVNHLSGTGQLNLLNSTFLNNSSMATVFSGIVSGSGNLEKIGVESLTLSGANTAFAGNATVTAGTLILNNLDAISAANSTSVGSSLDIQSPSGAIVPNLQGTGSVLLTQDGFFQNSFFSTFSGVISGSGNLQKAGASTLRLDGPNTYMGSTSIQGGILSVTTASLPGNCFIALGSSLVMDQNFNGSFGSTIFGDGSFLKLGSGTVTLNGNNFYTGGTTVNEGTLIVDTASLPGDTVLQSMTHLIFDQNVNGAFTGAISGDGDFTKQGGGTLTLTGTNSFTGPTALSAGTLIGSTASLPSDISTAAGTLLTFDQAFDAVFSNTISGDGLVDKQGVGSLTLSSVNMYAGLTTVLGGTLSITGAISNDILVTTGGILKGTGIIGGSADIQGVLAPGTSIGELQINGNLTQEPTSTLSIEISPSEASRVTVMGDAFLDGTLELLFQTGSYLFGMTYTLLSANTVNGTFPTVIDNMPQLPYSLVYGSNFLQLVIQGNLVAIPLDGLKGNIRIVAEYLNELFALPEFALLVTDIAMLPFDQRVNAINHISPARNAFGSYTMQNTAFSFADVISLRLLNQRFERYRKEYPIAQNFSFDELYANNAEEIFFRKNKPLPKPRSADMHTIWITGFGEFSKESSRDQNPDFNVETWGFVGGIDRFGENSLCGLAFGYANSHISEDDSFGNMQISYYQGTLYGTFYVNAFYVEWGSWAGFNEIRNKRHVVYPGFDKKASSYSNSFQITPHFAMGYDFNWFEGVLEPYVSLDYAVNFNSGSKETGAEPFNMHQNSFNASMLRSEAGLAAFHCFSFESGRMLLLKERFSYVNKVPFSTGIVTAGIVGAPGSFTVESLDQVQNLFSPSFEVHFKSEAGFFITLDYLGEFGRKYHSNQVNLEIGKYF